MKLFAAYLPTQFPAWVQWICILSAALAGVTGTAQTKEIKADLPVYYVIVDQSGSMKKQTEWDGRKMSRMEAMKERLSAFVGYLPNVCDVTVIMFDDTVGSSSNPDVGRMSFYLREDNHADERRRIRAFVQKRQPNSKGGTSIYDALGESYLAVVRSTLREAPDRDVYFLFYTDGKDLNSDRSKSYYGVQGGTRYFESLIERYPNLWLYITLVGRDVRPLISKPGNHIIYGTPKIPVPVGLNPATLFMEQPKSSPKQEVSIRFELSTEAARLLQGQYLTMIPGEKGIAFGNGGKVEIRDGEVRVPVIFESPGSWRQDQAHSFDVKLNWPVLNRHEVRSRGALSVKIAPVEEVIVTEVYPSGGDFLTERPIRFHAVAPTDARVSWDFGDGSPVAVGATVYHSYVGTGDFTATCKVEQSGKKAFQQEINLRLRRVSLELESEVSEVLVDTPIQVSAKIMPEPTSLKWFVNGALDKDLNGKDVMLRVQESGTYNIEVTGKFRDPSSGELFEATSEALVVVVKGKPELILMRPHAGSELEMGSLYDFRALLSHDERIRASWGTGGSKLGEQVPELDPMTGFYRYDRKIAAPIKESPYDWTVSITSAPVEDVGSLTDMATYKVVEPDIEAVAISPVAGSGYYDDDSEQFIFNGQLRNVPAAIIGSIDQSAVYIQTGGVRKPIGNASVEVDENQGTLSASYALSPEQLAELITTREITLRMQFISEIPSHQSWLPVVEVTIRLNPRPLEVWLEITKDDWAWGEPVEIELKSTLDESSLIEKMRKLEWNFDGAINARDLASASSGSLLLKPRPVFKGTGSEAYGPKTVGAELTTTSGDRLDLDVTLNISYARPEPRLDFHRNGKVRNVLPLVLYHGDKIRTVDVSTGDVARSMLLINGQAVVEGDFWKAFEYEIDEASLPQTSTMVLTLKVWDPRGEEFSWETSFSICTAPQYWVFVTALVIGGALLSLIIHLFTRNGPAGWKVCKVIEEFEEHDLERGRSIERKLYKGKGGASVKWDYWRKQGSVTASRIIGREDRTFAQSEFILRRSGEARGVLTASAPLRVDGPISRSEDLDVYSLPQLEKLAGIQRRYAKIRKRDACIVVLAFGAYLYGLYWVWAAIHFC